MGAPYVVHRQVTSIAGNLRMDVRTIDVERSEMIEARTLSGRTVAGKIPVLATGEWAADAGSVGSQVAETKAPSAVSAPGPAILPVCVTRGRQNPQRSGFASGALR